MRELRPYNVKDLNTMVSLLASLRNSKLKTIMTVPAPASKDGEAAAETEANTGALVFDVLGELWEQSGEALFVWFASLNSMPIEEFLDSPPDIVLETIEAIVENPDTKSFFSKASGLFRKIADSKTAIKKR